MSVSASLCFLLVAVAMVRAATVATPLPVNKFTEEVISVTVVEAVVVTNDTKADVTTAELKADVTTAEFKADVTTAEVKADVTTAEFKADVTTAEFTTSSNVSSGVEVPVYPPLPYQCYDCNSGSPLPGMWKNPSCTAEGYVAEWYTPRSCDTFCFSSVGLYPAGTVTRGCGDALYFPNNNAEDGCFDDARNNRHICLCSGDRCNTHNLTEQSAYYVEKHLSMQATTP